MLLLIFILTPILSIFLLRYWEAKERKAEIARWKKIDEERAEFITNELSNRMSK